MKLRLNDIRFFTIQSQPGGRLMIKRFQFLFESSTYNSTKYVCCVWLFDQFIARSFTTVIKQISVCNLTTHFPLLTHIQQITKMVIATGIGFLLPQKFRKVCRTQETAYTCWETPWISVTAASPIKLRRTAGKSREYNYIATF